MSHLQLGLQLGLSAQRKYLLGLIDHDIVGRFWPDF